MNKPPFFLPYIFIVPYQIGSQWGLIIKNEEREKEEKKREKVAKPGKKLTNTHIEKNNN